MNVVVWIVSGLLAAVFLMAGGMKLAKSKDELVANPAMEWAKDFPAGLITFIGLAEVAAALGLILPGAFGVATWLVPAAAIGLVLMMIGAAITHARFRQYPNVGVNLVLLAMAAFVAVMRIGPQSF